MRSNSFLIAAVGAVLTLLAPTFGIASGLTSVEGVLQRQVEDDFAHDDARHDLVLLTEDGRRIRLDSGKDGGVPVAGGSHLAVTGTLSGSVLSVTSSRSLPSSPAALRVAMSGPRTVAVLLLNFQNDPREPWTPAEIRSRVFTDSDSVAAYYQEVSGGTVSLTGKVEADGDVFGWYTVPYTSGTSCYGPDSTYDDWANAARAAAIADGKDLSGYDNIIYAWAPVQPCPFAGVAELSGDESWINAQALEFFRSIVAHELGHNFGLDHASTWKCTDDAGQPVSISEHCEHDEYGDPFDVMGAIAPRHISNWNKYHLAFLDPAESPLGTTFTVGAGTFELTLAPQEQPLAGTVQTVRIPDPSQPPIFAGPSTLEEAYYYLEFRQPFGLFDDFSPADAVVNGVSIRIAPDPSSIRRSHLIDATPETPDFFDAALGVGRTFVDRDQCLAITTLGVSPDGASIRIERESDGSDPSQPAGVYAEPISPTRAYVSWSASTDDIGVSAYEVFAVTPSGDTSVGTTNDTHLVVDGLSGAAAAYYVVAKDRCRNRSANSPAVDFRFPDTRPQVTITSGTFPRPGRNPRVKATVTDGPIDRIEMYIDGVLVRRRDYGYPRIERTIGWTARLRTLPKGDHFVTIRAYGGTDVGATGFAIRTF